MVERERKSKGGGELWMVSKADLYSEAAELREPHVAEVVDAGGRLRGVGEHDAFGERHLSLIQRYVHIY